MRMIRRFSSDAQCDGWWPGFQEEVEARPVWAAQHHLRAEDGHRRLRITDTEPAHQVRAGAAERHNAGGRQREDATQQKVHRGTQTGKSDWTSTLNHSLSFCRIFDLCEWTSFDSQQKHQVELLEMTDTYDRRNRGKLTEPLVVRTCTINKD